MAVYNEILVGRWNRFIQKLTGIKGGPPARQLGSEIVMGHPIFHGVENRYLESWERFGFVVSQGAGAAATSDIRFRNPSGSNMVAVIEQLLINAGTTLLNGFIELGPTNADLATLVPMTTARLDARSRPTPTLIASRTNAGAFLGVAILPWQTAANGSTISIILTDDQELTLLPGDAIQVDEQVVNSGLQIGLVWRERFLEDSERF